MRVIILSIALLFCAFSAQSQVLKSAGVWYFLDVDSMTARPAVLPNGTELAYVVGTKKIYYWNRTTSTWTEYSTGSDSTFSRDSIYFDSSIVGSGTVSDPWGVDSTLFATIAGVGDSIANALLGYLPIEGGTLTGTGGAGFIGFPSQVSAPGTPASGLNVFASGSAFTWKGTDGHERQFASTLTGGRTYTLPDISGTFALGTGTADRSARWSATNTLAAGNFTDNGTKLQALLPFQLQQWTTAGRPSGTLGYTGFNTSNNIPEWYDGSAWDQMHTPWTVNGTTTSIPFNLSASRYIYFNPDVAFSSGPFGFQYNNNNDFRFGLQAGARIQFQDAGGSATMSGSWNFPANANYPANVNLAASSSSSNDVRLVVTRSGAGANQVIYQYAQRYATDNNAPLMITGATNHTWGTRRTTTNWNTVVDSSRMHLAQNGDLHLYSGPGYYYTTTQARLNVVGRGTSTTYPLLLLENLGGTDRFSVLENGEVRIPTLSAIPTRIVGADADGDLGALALSGLSISSGTLSAQSIYNLLPTSDVQIAAANNSLRLNSLDTMKMNHAIITTPSSTNLLLLNPNVGATGYPSGVGGGYHTVINGILNGVNAGTGHIVIGGATTANGYNFMTNLGYSSLVGGNYAIGLGYDADATAEQSMAIGYGARADEDYEISIGSNNYDKLNLWAGRSGGRIVAVNYGTGTKEAADLSKTQSNYITGFATDGTVLDLERKRDTTIFLTADTDYDFSAAVTTAQIASRYNRIIIHMTLTSGVGADKTTTLHTPDANLMQCEILIRGTDNTGTYDNEIAFGTNNAISSDGTNTSGYTLAQGQGLHVRVVYNGSAYKYIYY